MNEDHSRRFFILIGASVSLVVIAVVIAMSLFRSPPETTHTEQITAHVPLEHNSAQQAALSNFPQRLVIPSIAYTLILIQPGTFMMGSPSGEKGRSPFETLHEVTLTKPFYIGETEVTQEQWYTILDSNPSYFDGDNVPVERVSWLDAVDFCNKVSAKEGRETCYSIDGTTVIWNAAVIGYRLPTEAEWEYSCRAGSSDERYGLLPEIAWYKENAENKTHSVKQKQPNSWGLYDMLGNVWEWCYDSYEAYKKAPVIDPQGPQTGMYKVLRGGSIWTYPAVVRAAAREGYVPTMQDTSLGFRLALNAVPAPEPQKPEGSEPDGSE